MCDPKNTCKLHVALFDETGGKGKKSIKKLLIIIIIIIIIIIDSADTYGFQISL